MNTFNIELDLESKVRLYLQLYTQISLKVESGELPAGTKLPSVRTLSSELNVSKNTITKAYEELQNDGFIVSREKSGFFINDLKGENPDFLSDSEPFIPTVDSILYLHQDDDDPSEHIEIPGSEELLSELSINKEKGENIFAKDTSPSIADTEEFIFDEIESKYSSANTDDVSETVESTEPALSDNSNDSMEQAIPDETREPDNTTDEISATIIESYDTETSEQTALSSEPSKPQESTEALESNITDDTASNSSMSLDFTIPSDDDPEEASSNLFFAANYIHHDTTDNVNIVFGSEDDETESFTISGSEVDTDLDLNSKITTPDKTENESEETQEPESVSTDAKPAFEATENSTPQQEQKAPEEKPNTQADDLIPIDSEQDKSYAEPVFHSATDGIVIPLESEDEDLEDVAELNEEEETTSDPISLAEQYELPPLEFETEMVDPESLEESIRTSFNEILSLPGSFMYKKSPAFGESCLKYAICHLLSTFRGVEVAPEQIIIASTDQMLLHNVLSLSSLNPMSQIYTHYTPGLGLLKKAETYSVKQDLLHNLTVGFIPENTFNAEKTFNDLRLQTVHLSEDSFGITPKSLTESDATIIYSSRKDVPIGFKDDIIKRREEILDWAIAKPYRFIIENDAHTTENSDISFLHSDKSEKVIYINSFTNLICKGVSGAWLVLPKHLIPEYQSRYFFRDCTISVLDQLFLTDFINSGKLNTYLSNLELL